MPPVDEPLVVDINPWWPKNTEGGDRPVRAVAAEFLQKKGIYLPEKTISHARKGTLSKGEFIYLARLAQLCSFYAGESVTIEQILRPINKQ